MPPRNRPAPGTIRITPVNASPSNVGLPPQFGQTVSSGSSPLKWTLLLLALLGFLFIWGYEGQNQPQTDSNPVTSATPGPAAQVPFDDASTPRDVRGSPQYAAFIWRDNSSTASTSDSTSDTPSETTSAMVFTDGRLDIRVVNSKDEIPADILLNALFASSLSAYPQTNDSTTDSASVSVSGVTKRIGREVPIIFDRDVNIQIGDLTNTNSLITELVAQHGELKAASLTLVDGSPRAPPTETLEPREVYIVGKIETFVGPRRFDASVHNAQIIDLDNVNSDSRDPQSIDTEADVSKRFGEPGRDDRDSKSEKKPNENAFLHPENHRPKYPEYSHPEYPHPKYHPEPHPHRPAVRPGIP